MQLLIRHNDTRSFYYRRDKSAFLCFTVAGSNEIPHLVHSCESLSTMCISKAAVLSLGKVKYSIFKDHDGSHRLIFRFCFGQDRQCDGTCAVHVLTIVSNRKLCDM
jgi:hypothetical protein